MHRIKMLCIVLLSLGFFQVSAQGSEPPVIHLDCPRQIVLGEPFRLTVSSAVHFQEVQLGWRGRSLRVPLKLLKDRASASLLLGTDVKSDAPGMMKLVVRASKYGIKRRAEARIEVLARSAPVQKLTLPPGKVFLNPSDLKRHQQERKEVQAALQTSSMRQMWSCPFLRPAEGGVSSVYGLKRILNGQPKSPHRGLDIRSGDKARVVACNHGLVILTAEHFFAGKCVYVDHGLGVISMYFHLSSIAVQEGQPVAKGQSLGLSGSTGRATGPHLHFGISLNQALVNPVPLFADNCQLIFE